MKLWRLGAEPQTAYLSGNPDAMKLQVMNCNLFLHPSLQLIKQTEDFNYTFTPSDRGWWHPAMPYLTNHDVAAANSYWIDNNAAAMDALETWMSGMQTNLYSPNIAWGGNPVFASILDYHTTSPSKENGRIMPTAVQPVGFSGTPITTQNDHFRVSSGNITGGGASDVHYLNQTSQYLEYKRYLTMLNLSKSMMTMGVNVNKAAPRIVFKTKPIPENTGTVTWTFMAEFTSTILIKPNIMGFSPLDLGNVFAGWCGYNAWGHCTGPIPMVHQEYNTTQGSGSRMGPNLFNLNSTLMQQPLLYSGNFPSFLSRRDFQTPFDSYQHGVNEYAADIGQPNPYLEGETNYEDANDEL